MNPIIGREVRSRWRGIKAFGLVLGYAAPLTIAIVIAYSSVLPRAEIHSSFATRHLGLEVFSALAWIQVLAWMFFAPTLTATTIAGEREHGLLESLQLSPLTPWQIVTGKLASALLFVLLMMIASFPVQAICLMMGGVSPAEFIIVLTLAFSTAIACATIGITCSAWTRRGAVALRSTFILIVVWAIGSSIAWSMSVPGPTLWEMLWFWVTRAIGITNPVVAVISVLDRRMMGSSFPPPSSGATGIFDFLLSTPQWVACVASQAIAVMLMLWSSARAVRHPLPEQHWIEPRTSDSALAMTGSGSQQRRSHMSAGRGWWNVPILSQLRFDNPVLMREARGKFRMRQVSTVFLVFEAMLGLGVFVFYCYLIYLAIYEPDSREGIWYGISFIGLLVLMIAAPIMGAGAFTREREAGTWQGLMLSSLHSRDITFGKAGATLLTCFFFTIPLWPLLALCLTSSGPSTSGVPLLQAALSLAIVVSTTWCYTMIGMAFSWFCKRTPVAVGWTVATLFGINLFLPMILSAAGAGTGVTFFMHPWFALSGLLRMGESNTWDYYPISALISTLICQSVLGLILFNIIDELMRGRDREKDRGHLRKN